MRRDDQEEVLEWNGNVAIAACLHTIVEDLESGVAEGFSPTCTAVESLEEGSDHDPRTETGFRSWLNTFAGSPPEVIDKAVAKVREQS